MMLHAAPVKKESVRVGKRRCSSVGEASLLNNEETFSLSPTSRVKRPSVSLQDIFSASLRTRFKWLLALSLPVMAATNTQSLAWVALSFATVAGVAAYEAIPSFGRLLLHAGRKGQDLNKLGRPILPESLGKFKSQPFL